MARIKGQDVELSVTQNGTTQAFSTKAISNFEVTPKFEKLEEQYLGQTSKKYDDIFHGVDFKFDMHLEETSFLAFIDAVKTRAQSRVGDTVSKVNISAKLQFSSGPRTIILKECYFEDMPLNFSGRSAYGQFTLSGSCNDISF